MMNDEAFNAQVEALLAPAMTAALGQISEARVDGYRLGLGVAAAATDAYIQTAATTTAPEHLHAVVATLHSLATTIREQSARFSLDQSA